MPRNLANGMVWYDLDDADDRAEIIAEAREDEATARRAELEDEEEAEDA